MTPIAERLSPDDARRFLVQSLWLTRGGRPTADGVRETLGWLLDAADTDSVPPAGIVADFGRFAHGQEPDAAAVTSPPGWSPRAAREYEDYVLGKLYADRSFERAADAVRRIEPKLRGRAVAFLMRRIADRLGVAGVEIPPPLIRGLLAAESADLLAEGMQSLSDDGPMPVLVRQYENWVAACRRAAELLGADDVTALQHGTAVADLGLYVAHRQVVRLAARIDTALPARPVKPFGGRKEVPTRVHAEDAYPVGGYTSISNRGGIESLLYSQLAYMETDVRPDLFDVKYVRDELFYYSRDENQFLRRRRSFVFAFHADLTAAQVKDADLPAQRLVMLSATVLAVVRKLVAWLSTDAVRFELLFVAAAENGPLAAEIDMFRIVLRDLTDRGVAAVEIVPTVKEIETRCRALSRTSQTHVVSCAAVPPPLDVPDAVVSAWAIDGPRPRLTDGKGNPYEPTAEDPLNAWPEVAVRLLRLWV